MLRDAAVDLLMNRLGQRKGSSLQAQIIGEMVYVQENILEGNATQFWLTLKDSSGLTTIASTETVALPTDFLQEWENGGLYLTQADGAKVELIKDTWDNIAVHEHLLGEAQPTHYDMDLSSFLFRKVPDIAYALNLKYHAQQTDLTGAYGDSTNVENGWLKYASDWLIAETGIIIAGQYLQSKQMVGVFAAQSKTALDRLIKRNTAWYEANRTRGMDA